VPDEVGVGQLLLDRCLQVSVDINGGQMSINSFDLHESPQMFGNIFDENGVNDLRQTTRNIRIISIRKVKLKSYHSNEISVVYIIKYSRRVDVCVRVVDAHTKAS
jgi:hypothetical protein